jgi:glycosyltransferase involved in cell wall biosynthesis
MYKDKKISVVVPAYNEEMLIEHTLRSIPDYIDKIYAVDDGSPDNTFELIEEIAEEDRRIIPIKHEVNRGVGAAIVTGYKRSLEDDIDIAVVMAGDNQMDPAYIPSLVDPIIENRADYTKGNRLMKAAHMRGMSYWRRLGNSLLTLLTKFSSGYWNIMDPQNGYTAISRNALETIDLDSIYPSYGYCNDLLMKLNVFSLRVIDISIPCRYGKEKSKIRYDRYIIKVSWLLLGNFFYRIKMKYLFLSLNPIAFFYLAGIILVPIGLILGINKNPIFLGTVFSLPILLLGLQLFLFAIIFDINMTNSIYNKE